MKIMVFIAQSLDGYIAKPDGDIEWLNRMSEKAKNEDHGYDSLMEMTDYLIMGRKSFEKVRSFGFWPYEGQKVIVLSSTLKEIPEEFVSSVEIYSGDVNILVDKLEKQGCNGLYIDGATTIQNFIHNALVTEMTITTVPILLGEGISLFGKLDNEVELKHTHTTSFPSGMVQSKYSL